MLPLHRIKLPRKRKKAYLKKYGIADYVSAQIIGQILHEERPSRKATRFPEFEIVKRKCVLIRNW